MFLLFETRFLVFPFFFVFVCFSLSCVFSTFPFCSFSFGLLVVCVFLRLFCRVCVVCFCLVVFFLFHVSLLRFTLFLPFSVILFSSRFEFATPCNSLSKILLVLLNMCLPTPHLQLHLLNLMLRFIPLLCPVPTAPREIHSFCSTIYISHCVLSICSWMTSASSQPAMIFSRFSALLAALVSNCIYYRTCCAMFSLHCIII